MKRDVMFFFFVDLLFSFLVVDTLGKKGWGGGWEPLLGWRENRGTGNSDFTCFNGNIMFRYLLY